MSQREGKLSKYNVFTTDKNGDVLLTNTVSNALIKIHSDNKNILNESWENLLNKRDYKYLKSSNVIVDEDLSVDQIYEYAVNKSKRLDIVILTTNQCNFSCVYCFQKRENYFLNHKQYDALLSFIENKISSEGYTNVKIRWFGGEPLLGKEGIVYFSEKLNELKKRIKFTYGCGIITNGYLLNEDMFRVLYKYGVVTYQVSIDGLPSISHRLLKDGSSSFDIVLNNLRKIRDNIKYRMFTITIRINFTQELVKKSDEIVNFFAKEFGNDSRFAFSFIPVFDWSYKDSDFMKAKQLKKELVHESDVAEIMKRNSQRLDFKAWTNLLYAHNECWAGTRHGYTIDANGDILKCDFKLENFDDNRVGRITENGELYIEKEKEKKWIFESPMEECYNCSFFPLCLSTSCGAARLQGIMLNKCESFKQRVLNDLEIESYSKRKSFVEVEI